MTATKSDTPRRPLCRDCADRNGVCHDGTLCNTQSDKPLTDVEKFEAGEVDADSFVVTAEFAEKLEHQLTETRRLLAEASKDAERYRWLRGHHRSDIKHRLVWYLPRNVSNDETGLDAAIDAAIKERP